MVHRFRGAVTNVPFRIYFLPEAPKCETPVDITFLVDSSGSISRANYLREKSFIKAVAKSFGISRTQSRAALVLFSNSASVQIRFQDYSSTKAFQVNAII